MANIDLGKLAFSFRGTYNNSTSYVPKDVVTFTDNGVLGTYICVTATTGNNPSSSGTAHANWVFMSKSASGIYDGSLALGNAGDALKVNSAGNSLEFGVIEGSVISTLGTMFANWNDVNTNTTSNLPTDKNQFLVGPISVTGSAVWTLTGSGTLKII